MAGWRIRYTIPGCPFRRFASPRDQLSGIARSTWACTSFPVVKMVSTNRIRSLSCSRTDILEIVRDEGNESDIDFRNSGIQHLWTARQESVRSRVSIAGRRFPRRRFACTSTRTRPSARDSVADPPTQPSPLRLINDLFRLKIPVARPKTMRPGSEAIVLLHPEQKRFVPPVEAMF